RDDDAKVVAVALDAGSQDAPLANKARAWGIRTVRNLVLTGIAAGLGAVYLGYGNQIGRTIAKDSEVAKRIVRIVLSGEQELLEILAHLPADARAALKTVLDVIRHR